MKKTQLLALLMLVALTFKGSAQTVPNGGFENWSMDSTMLSENPEGWFCINYSTLLVTVAKSTDKHGGTYSAKMTPNTNVQYVPSILSTIIPTTTAGHYLNFSCKATVSSSDTFMVYVATSNNSGAGAITQSSISSWGNYYLDLSGVTGTFDSLELGFYVSGTNNPEAYIDDLSFGSTPVGTIFGTPVTGLPALLHQGSIAGLSVYPNPVQTTTNIEYNVQRASDVRIAITDLTGREVQVVYQGNVKPGKQQVTADCSTLKNGIYFITVRTGEMNLTSKMIVNR